MNIARLKSDPEIFYSLQGEGARVGTPAVFLRLAGCNLSCTWCDTKHSWGAGMELSVAEVAQRLQAYSCRNLVITGGEPLLQQEEIAELLELLPPDYVVEVETNGSIEPSRALRQRVDWWNVSPKLQHSGNDAGKALSFDALEAFAEMPNVWFKFVVQGEADWRAIDALELPQHQIMLMPCAATRAELAAARPAVAEMCLQHGVRLGERLHLVLWDTKKGV